MRSKKPLVQTARVQAWETWDTDLLLHKKK